MWESPIQIVTDDIVKDIVQKQDGCLVEYVHRVGFNIDKDELAKALKYDRDQYEKGYADGRRARDSEIVRCRDCKWHEDEEPGMVWCPHIVGNWVNDNWFCAEGNRKEVEDGEES